jgi:CRISPR type IV-associated protein Csf3
MQDGRVAGTEPWFPLDSILASVWIRRNHPDLAELPTMDTRDIIDAQLPFERRGQGNDWYWACSFNQGTKLGEYIVHWHKRQDDHMERYIDFQGKRGKIHNKSGKYKGYRMPLVVQLFEQLIWYAVGDLEAILDLCHGVTHIGKKSSQGFGAVDCWTVAPWPEDWSERRQGNVTRALPLREGEPLPAGRIARYGIRPPYWESGRGRVCLMPEVADGQRE